VIGAMDEDEYNNLLNYLQTIEHSHSTYNKSAVAFLNTFIQDMPRNAATAADIVDNFDANKYQQVIDFAKAANGNRLI
jgi:hypothetical protein